MFVDFGHGLNVRRGSQAPGPWIVMGGLGLVGSGLIDGGRCRRRGGGARGARRRCRRGGARGDSGRPRRRGGATTSSVPPSRRGGRAIGTHRPDRHEGVQKDGVRRASGETVYGGRLRSPGVDHPLALVPRARLVPGPGARRHLVPRLPVDQLEPLRQRPLLSRHPREVGGRLQPHGRHQPEVAVVLGVRVHDGRRDHEHRRRGDHAPGYCT